MTRLSMALLFCATAAHAQTVIEPGHICHATARALDATGTVIAFPVGSLITWQQGPPAELVDLLPPGSGPVVPIQGKQGLQNSVPLAGTIIAVYQNGATVVTKAAPIVLAPAPTVAPPPPTVIPPTVPPGSVVKGLAVTVDCP